MGPDLGRRAFLRGGSRPPQKRPPWSVDESRFAEACDRCDLCARACPERLIVKGDGGFPVVEFRRGGCTFCGDCVQACPRGALDRQAFAEAAPPWALTAAIGDRCLLPRGVECRVCGDHCEPRAIRFRPAVGGKVQLILDGEACTGCGGCVRPCPAGAITITVKQRG